MSISPDILRRVAALRLSAEGFREVLAIIADVQAEIDRFISAIEERKRRDRERKTPTISMENPGKLDGNSSQLPAEIPGNRQSISSFLPTLSSSGSPLESKKEHSSGRGKYASDFENRFWKPYPRTPVMSKKEAFAEWEKTSPEDQKRACSALEPYKRFLSEKPDHPAVHACRFLSQRRFEGFEESAAAASTTSPGPPTLSPEWRKLNGWPEKGLPGDAPVNPGIDLLNHKPEAQGVLRNGAQVRHGDDAGGAQFFDDFDDGPRVS